MLEAGDAPKLTDWLAGIGAAVAALAALVAASAAVYAAIYTRRAADASAKAAEKAAEQVELQRPRPVITATCQWSFSQTRRDTVPRDKEIELTNIGNSPAFDVKVSQIETPDKATRLLTEEVAYLSPGVAHKCAHRVEPARGVVGILGGAGSFVNDLVSAFDEQGRSETFDINTPHSVPFTLSYRALDGRIFEQPYSFVVYFPQLRAWIEPVGSLLRNNLR